MAALFTDKKPGSIPQFPDLEVIFRSGSVYRIMVDYSW